MLKLSHDQISAFTIELFCTLIKLSITIYKNVFLCVFFLKSSATISMLFSTHFPKSFFIPFDFFLLSGVVDSVFVLSLLADLCGSPARSRWSVPWRSISAVKTSTHRISITRIRVGDGLLHTVCAETQKADRHMMSGPRQSERWWQWALKAIPSLVRMHQTQWMSD